MEKMRNYLMTVLILCSAICLYGCVNHIDDDEADTTPEDSAIMLKVHTRTGNSAASLSYPVKVYAFRSADGSLAATETLNSASDELRLSLAAGNYRLVALAGTGGYALPDTPTPDATIGFATGNTSTEALMMGSADIHLDAANATATLTLSYCVARLDITLSGIPVDATAVKVSLSPQYKTISFRGDYSGGGEVSDVVCRKDDTNWTATTCHLMSGSGQNTVLSIAVNTPVGVQTYGYTYSHPLVAATPYVFAGNYQEGFSVNGSLIAKGWNPAVQVDFNFGINNGGDTGEKPEEGDTDPDLPDGDESVTVTQLPAAGTLWQGHLVAAVQTTTPTSAELLLLSLDEWQGVSSAAAAAKNPGEAAALAAAYVENGLAGWHIPTLDEAKLLTKTYGTATKLEALNSALIAAPAATILKGKENDNKGNAVRYLCNEGTHSFSLASTTGGNTEAGHTRTYNLRVAKILRVEIKKG